MDMFKLGQMLGNAYGNLWVANANKRDDKKIEEIKNNLGGLSSKDINDALGGETMVSPINGPDDSVGTLQGGFNETGNAVSAPAQSIARPNSTNGAPIIAGNDLPDPTGLAWRPKYTASDLDMAMRDRGIGKGSRDRALAQYKTELADQAQKEMLPDIVKAISSGNTQDALGALLQYRKYDPETANILAKDYQSALQYKRQQDLQDKHFNNQLALQNNALQNKIAYKGAVGSGGGGGRAKTTKPEKMMTADGLTKQIDKIQAEIDALPSGSPEFMAKSATRDKLKGEYDALVNYGVEGQREYNDNYKAQREFVQNYDFNLNDWNQAAYLANDMIYRQAIPPRETIAKIKAAGAPDWVVSSLEGSYKDIL